MGEILEFPSNGSGKRSTWWLAHIELQGETQERQCYIPVDKIGQGVQEIDAKVREVGRPLVSLWIELVSVPGGVPNVG